MFINYGPLSVSAGYGKARMRATRNLRFHPAIGVQWQSGFVQDLSGDAKAFERPAAVAYPFMHIAVRADHGEVHHAACLGVDHLVVPAESLAPGNHRFLERAHELVVGESRLDIVCSKRRLALLEPSQNQVVIEIRHESLASCIRMVF
jgi:hypothetical protein